MQSKRISIKLKNGQKHNLSIINIELVVGNSIIKGIDLETKKPIEIKNSDIVEINNHKSVYYNYREESVFLSFEEAIHLSADNQIKYPLEILTEQEAFLYILEHKIQIKRMVNYYARESKGEIKHYVEGNSGFKSFYARNLIDLCNYFEIATHSIRDVLESLDWYKEQSLYAQ